MVKDICSWVIIDFMVWIEESIVICDIIYFDDVNNMSYDYLYNYLFIVKKCL